MAAQGLTLRGHVLVSSRQICYSLRVGNVFRLNRELNDDRKCSLSS